MKDYLIIKIFRPYFSDNSIPETRNRYYNGARKRLQKIAKARNEQLLLSVYSGVGYFEGDAIVDVYFSKELSEEDKNIIAKEVACFMSDRPRFFPNEKLFQVPATVFFHKLADCDVLEI